SAYFVMPVLVDVHTHLAYGNAKSEEDIDLYSPLEFRTLRGMFFAQKVAAAGFTAICSPGDAGQISLSIRNAIRAGLFDGPRVMAAGRYVTTHQGLTDWHPSWTGAPGTSSGKPAQNIAEGTEELPPPHQPRSDRGPRQRPATPPPLPHPRIPLDFTHPHEPAYLKGRPHHAQREYEIVCVNWKEARAAGVPILTGTDTGFAVPPYGEWNARELELFVQDLGFT